MSVELGKHANLTDNQLSVHAWFLEAKRNLLAFDMGVWGPFGARLERQWICTVHHLDASGQYVSQDMAGAGDMEDWLAAWEY